MRVRCRKRPLIPQQAYRRAFLLDERRKKGYNTVKSGAKEVRYGTGERLARNFYGGKALPRARRGALKDMKNLFALPKGLKAEEFPVITEQNKFAFCDLRGYELRPPFRAGTEVLLPVLLSSCVLNIVFEGVKEFSCGMGEETAPFSGYTLCKKGKLYEYGLKAGEGSARILFAGARVEACGVLPARGNVEERLAEARARIFSLPEAERKRIQPRPPRNPREYFPSMEELCLPFFAEKEELGIRSEGDEPLSALWRLYRALFDEIEEDAEGGQRVRTGGFAAYFEGEDFDLAPLLKKYAPAIAADYAAAKAAHERGDGAALCTLVLKYTAGRYRPCGSGAAMARADWLDRNAHPSALRYRGALRRQAAQRALFARALCAIAREMSAEQAQNIRNAI